MSCAQQYVNVDMRNAIHPVHVSLQFIYTRTPSRRAPSGSGFRIFGSGFRIWGHTFMARSTRRSLKSRKGLTILITLIALEFPPLLSPVCVRAFACVCVTKAALLQDGTDGDCHGRHSMSHTHTHTHTHVTVVNAALQVSL